MTLDRHALLRAAAARLPGPSPRLDAELLLAHALGEARLSMLLGNAPVPEAAARHFAALVEARQAHVPVAYLTGVREFWSLPFHLSPDVLIPRPDSETLIEGAIAAFGDRAPVTILDLGTGSGALLLAALAHWPGARGLGIDCSLAALRIARENARALGLAERASFAVGDWGTGVGARFDLLLSNPPYVAEGAVLAPEVARHEPARALFAGADGLEAYRRLVPMLPGLLAPGGVAVLELGVGQAGDVLALAAGAGLSGAVCHDLGQRERALLLRARGGLGKAGAGF